MVSRPKKKKVKVQYNQERSCAESVFAGGLGEAADSTRLMCSTQWANRLS